MEHSPYWEADSRSASQQIQPPFIKTEGSLPCSQEPGTGPYPELNGSSLHPPIFV
jgi:hypothetical protein